MKTTIMEEIGRHKLLMIFIAGSFALLIMFSLFQYGEFKMLSLEIKWFAVAAAPILIGLFIGGYIKNFKGFGLELEYNLKEPLPSSVISKVDIAESPGLNKESLNQLAQLNTSEKNKINRLQFIHGRRGYYDPYAIEGHFRELKKLRFIEVTNEKGEFKYIFSAARFKQDNPDDPNHKINMQRAHDFIRSLEDQNFNTVIPFVVTDYVNLTDTLIDVYRKVKNSAQSKVLDAKKEILPVIDMNKKMIGVVERQKLEAKITEEVDKNIS